MAGEETQVPEGPETRGMSVGGMLMLAILPLLALVLVLGGLLVWRLIATDTTAGFSTLNAVAIGIGVLVVLAMLQSLRMIRRRAGVLVGRIDELTQLTRRIAHEDLTALGEALIEPDPSLTPIAPLDLNPDSPAELAELSRSFEELHGSLERVAARQMATLKGGVPGLIVTLARRNATLVDRQLALLDELEMGEKSPEVLGTYYLVDHYATRIRRNAESLLVLAGEPPPRVWPRSMEISDVVRAAVGEVEDYQRIEIVSLERAQLAGGAVADLAHLLAELLDNATQYSPPGTPVRVKSVFEWDGYRLTVTDRGYGLTNDEIAEYNEILRNPPALGQVLEPTMGMYVVSKLAARHGIAVVLIPGIPGLTAQMTIPAHLLERNLAEPNAYNRDFRRAHPHTGAGGQAVAERTVIDLTDPALTEDADDIEARHVRSEVTEPTGGLPVRSPGRALDEVSTSGYSVTEGESAIRIRAALAAYDQGRRAASPAPAEDQSDDETDQWRDPDE